MQEKIEALLSAVRLALERAGEKITKPVFGGIGRDIRTIGGMLISAGLIGFAVTGDTVTPLEATLILFLGFTLFVCGTIVEIEANK